MDLAKDLNMYDLYRTVYPDTQSPIKERAAFGKTTLKSGLTMEYKRGYTLKEKHPWLKVTGKEQILGDYQSDYLNRADVRLALHIPDTLGKTWYACLPEGTLTYPFFREGSIWIYNLLKEYSPKYKMVHWSGDTDGVVPTLGTRQWIDAQNWEVSMDWEQWTTDGQVSGYFIQYENIFTFATVHGVGHQAPGWKKKDMQEIITKYIHGEPIH